MTDNVKRYFGYFYFFGFFFILFFGRKYIDIVRGPFILFFLWQLLTRKLSPRFFIDPVIVCVLLFSLAAAVSNALNGIPQGDIIEILNWLYPYVLGKYAILYWRPRIDTENVLLILLGCAVLFSMVGIIGYLFDVQTIFGVELFKKSGNEMRYTFTISATNRAGFCIGVALIVNCYLYIKNGFRFTKKSVYLTICFAIALAGLFLIKERKTLLTVFAMISIFMLVYKRYKTLIVLAVIAGLMVAVFPLPQRYTFKEMVFNTGMQGRMNAWECALGLFKEKPILGHGFGSYKKASAAYYKENKASFRFKRHYNWAIAHNMNLNTLAETGILGFLFLNGVFFSAWRFVRYRQSAPLVFVLGAAIAFIYITMQFGNFVHSGTRTTLAFLIFGLYYAEAFKQRRPCGAAGEYS